MTDTKTDFQHLVLESEKDLHREELCGCGGITWPGFFIHKPLDRKADRWTHLTKNMK
jgi:hypothetical protein